jgi:hypothetical protein
MAESRLQRWARKKAEASKPAEPLPPQSNGPEPSPEERELAVNEALPEHEVLAKYNLPDPDTLELGADITGFMRKEIPELLRRKALRALWKTNPVLAVLDGLNDYDEDYTDAALATKTVNTLYKVGQGMFDKNARREEQSEVQIETQASLPNVIPPAPKQTPPVSTGNEPAPEAPVIPSAEPYPAELASSEAQEEWKPRYRPRMRFES